jgi:hypothetical protein
MSYAKLAPYLARRLGRCRLTALPLSQRGERVVGVDADDRVRVSGTAILGAAAYLARAATSGMVR